MKVGNLVRYSLYPHYELHKSGMTGLVLSEIYVEKRTRDLHLVDVVWGSDRPEYPAGTVCHEFVDELEVLDEK